MDAATLATERASTYRLLGRLCLAEVELDLLTALRETPTFGAALAGNAPSLLAALRVEYARLFLLNAPPYESVWLGNRPMLNTEPTFRVQEAYLAGGYSPAGQVAAPDHVGLELAYVGHLAAAEAIAATAADAEGVGSLQRLQRRFLIGHLGRWGPVWAKALERLAREQFYNVLGSVIAEFVLAELEAAAAAQAAPAEA